MLFEALRQAGVWFWDRTVRLWYTGAPRGTLDGHSRCHRGGIFIRQPTAMPIITARHKDTWGQNQKSPHIGRVAEGLLILSCTMDHHVF